LLIEWFLWHAPIFISLLIISKYTYQNHDCTIYYTCWISCSCVSLIYHVIIWSMKISYLNIMCEITICMMWAIRWGCVHKSAFLLYIHISDVYVTKLYNIIISWQTLLFNPLNHFQFQWMFTSRPTRGGGFSDKLPRNPTLKGGFGMTIRADSGDGIDNDNEGIHDTTLQLNWGVRAQNGEVS
jgi:hypothetical protein